MKIKDLIPSPVLFLIRVALHVCRRYGRTSYSQEGEDILLSRLLDEKKPGFFVDIGAHHPSRFSNTFYFYRRGWRGINIDAWPGSMRLFRLVRSRDINLEMAVSDRRETLEFHVFSEPLLNSANQQLAHSRRAALGEAEEPANVVKVPAYTLSSILEEHLPPRTQIDFMSIDVEGLDIKVLQSNDWEKFRPKYLLVEVLGESVSTLAKAEVSDFLNRVGYEPISKLVHTAAYRDKSLGPTQYI
jgi:FkbM family methyltransferase